MQFHGHRNVFWDYTYYVYYYTWILPSIWGTFKTYFGSYATIQSHFSTKIQTHLLTILQHIIHIKLNHNSSWALMRLDYTKRKKKFREKQINWYYTDEIITYFCKGSNKIVNTNTNKKMIIRKTERKTYFHGHGQHLVQLWLIYWWLSVIQNNTNTYYIEREVRLSVKMRWNHNDNENWPWKSRTDTYIVFSWNIYIYIHRYIFYIFQEWDCLYSKYLNHILTLLHSLNQNIKTQKMPPQTSEIRGLCSMKWSSKKLCYIFCIIF